MNDEYDSAELTWRHVKKNGRPPRIACKHKQSSLERTLISAAKCRKIRLHIVAIDFCATKDETLVHFESVNQLDGNLWFEQLGGLGEGFARIGRH